MKSQHKLALVLGGGGAAGNAWVIGVIAGLADVGVDLAAAADVVIGTSSGASAAALVCSGRPPAELYAGVLSRPASLRAPEPAREPESPRVPAPATAPERASGPAPGRAPAHVPPPATVFERIRAISAAATSAAELQRAMGAFGLERDAVLAPEAGPRRALVASRLPSHDWPDRPMVVVAVDAHTGELAAFDRESGVDLVDAVAASSALPGLAPTVSINGHRYVNGGVRSADNADLASGYAHVVVLSPFGGRQAQGELGGRQAHGDHEQGELGGRQAHGDHEQGELGGRQEPTRAEQFEGLRRRPEWGTDLASQVAGLRRQGSHVDVITPDADSTEAMGTDQMDPATRAPSARAGWAQGRREALVIRL